MGRGSPAATSKGRHFSYILPILAVLYVYEGNIRVIWVIIGKILGMCRPLVTSHAAHSRLDPGLHGSSLSLYRTVS
jgi:hypothetical protein